MKASPKSGPPITWAGWLRFLDSALEPGGDLSAPEIAGLLRRFLRCEPETGVDVLSRAFRGFGLGTARTRKDMPPGTGMLYHQDHAGPARKGDAGPGQTEEGRLIPGRLRVGAADGSYGQRRHIKAHEVAHIVLSSVIHHPKASEALRSSLAESSVLESYCEQIAAEMLLPAAVRQSWTYPVVDEMLSDRCRAALLKRGRRGNLAFEHLRALAQRHKASIRAVVSALRTHPLLDETGAGIAVLRWGPNRFTGRQEDLRVWQAAYPSWGYVITNRRASKLGFLAAHRAAGELATGETVDSQEVLTVKERVPTRRPTPGPARRWEYVSLATTCAYTSVDVRGEGRYLLAIWRWRDPREPRAG